MGEESEQYQEKQKGQHSSIQASAISSRHHIIVETEASSQASICLSNGKGVHF
jgi:hypothetical protein